MTVLTHLLDMDGVLVGEETAIEGSVEYVQLLHDHGVPYVVFTNNSRHAPEKHSEQLSSLGFPIEASHVYASALATARFVHSQMPGATVFAVGDPGLHQAPEEQGCKLVDISPEYVVIGESLDFKYSDLVKGAHFVSEGARFIGTNPDVNGPVEGRSHSACGAACALIEVSTGCKLDFIGKPNPLMMRGALDLLGVRANDAIMVGDRMDTDVWAGLELGLKTALVLTGSSNLETVQSFPFHPNFLVPRLLGLAGHLNLF